MVNYVQLKRLKSGVQDWNEWRRIYQNIQPDLSGANLVGANLSHADLSNSNLVEANLSNADLTGVNLTGADLSGSIVIGTRLSGSSGSHGLSQSELDDLEQRGANLGDTSDSSFPPDIDINFQASSDGWLSDAGGIRGPKAQPVSKSEPTYSPVGSEVLSLEGDLLNGIMNLLLSGINDLRHGRNKTVGALLIAIVSTHLNEVGLALPTDKMARDPEQILYKQLQSERKDAYFYYNALLDSVNILCKERSDLFADVVWMVQRLS
jgi:hypothetical protein